MCSINSVVVNHHSQVGGSEITASSTNKKKKKKKKKKKYKCAEVNDNLLVDNPVSDKPKNPAKVLPDRYDEEIGLLINSLKFEDIDVKCENTVSKERNTPEDKESSMASIETSCDKNVAMETSCDKNVAIENSKHMSDDDNNDDDVMETCENEDLCLDGLPWEVECTQDVWRVLKMKNLEPSMKKKILRKIKMLASGNWPRDLAKRLEGVGNGIRLYEAKINKGARILWEVSISFSARCSMNQDYSLETELLSEKGVVYADKIRIWNIALQHDEVPKMIDNIVHSHLRGKDCLIQKQLKGIKQEPVQVNHEKLPNKYVNDESFVKEVMQRIAKVRTSKNIESEKYLFFPPASPDQQEYHILKFYAFTSAMASRILSLTNSHYDFPFQVSELEHAIIHLEPLNNCPILLLGRSGTGKTTSCLYRLFTRYTKYWDLAYTAGPHLPKLQLPITSIDDVLETETPAQITHQPIQLETGNEDGIVPCLCQGPCGCEESKNDDPVESDQVIHVDKPDESVTVQSDNKVDGDIDHDAEGETENYEHLRQLLITKNEVLCNEIRKNFKELCHGTENKEFLDPEPSQYANIKDIPANNYPLFITTKDLLLLLDASLDGKRFFERDGQGDMIQDVAGWGKNKTQLSYLPLIDYENEDVESEDEEDQGAIEAALVRERQNTISDKVEVTYDVFSTEIWRLIKKNKDEECHPSLVWMEIKSFIKGCAEAFLNETGFLSKQQYINMGRKRAPNFTGNREFIYNCFLRYNKIKISSGYFDEMDVHFNIYKRLKETVIPEWGFHEVYVDETQDFTQAELLLLLRCSLNPNAMFFSGDTAQSIMRGVAFRFCDLKSLFLFAKQEFERNNLRSPVVVPKRVHQLTHNYRSHSGILKLATCIVQLLEYFFPDSFDHLSPDVGLFSGPKPVILNTDDFTEMAMLLQGSKRKTSAIEFGAHQVILVQNEESKQALPIELSYGLVLSIYEAKGLEFDDVLLYNFFKDSPVSYLNYFRNIFSFLYLSNTSLYSLSSGLRVNMVKQ